MGQKIGLFELLKKGSIEYSLGQQRLVYHDLRFSNLFECESNNNFWFYMCLLHDWYVLLIFLEQNIKLQDDWFFIQEL